MTTDMSKSVKARGHYEINTGTVAGIRNVPFKANCLVLNFLQ